MGKTNQNEPKRHLRPRHSMQFSFNIICIIFLYNNCVSRFTSNRLHLNLQVMTGN